MVIRKAGDLSDMTASARQSRLRRRGRRPGLRGLLLAAAVTAVLAGAAGVPAPGLAQPVETDEAARIEARQKELEALRQQMQLSAEREKELADEVAALDRDRAALTEDLVQTGERIARLERRVTDSEARLARLSENEQGIRASLNARRGVISEVLAALQRIGTKPPPAIAVQPEDPLSAVRSAILLGAVVALTRGLSDRARIIALDERGRDTDSVVFAEMLAGWRDEGVGETLCVIGGPDGLDPDLRRRADHVMAFGRATWPHMLARVMLCEQIYRATTILSGHPYHRA